MSVQWFPGHMTSARRKAAETMATVDVVVEVLDARLPEASSNPMIHELRRFRQRPCLKLLNKADLADPEVTRAWLAFFNAQTGVKAVAISAKKGGEVSRIPSLCQALAPHRDDNIKPLRMMVMGIPNVGKSTLINTLVGRRIAAVGDEPAITKNQQKIELSLRHLVIDTPGLMWPKIEHESDGYMLAASHAIGRNAVFEEEIAVELGKILLDRYPALLAARYQVAPEQLDAPGLVQVIAERRACRQKGGGWDREKAAMILLTDYRSGILGRISLETPQTRAALLAAKTCLLTTKAALSQNTKQLEGMREER